MIVESMTGVYYRRFINIRPMPGHISLPERLTQNYRLAICEFQVYKRQGDSNWLKAVHFSPNAEPKKKVFSGKLQYLVVI